MNLPRVLSYPPKHPYIDRLHGIAGEFVYRDEPSPKLPHFYDPTWLDAHEDDWDIVHFHFGWEQYPPAKLESVLKAHKDSDKPIFLTIHDTRSPHTQSSEEDAVYLSLLTKDASHVITLTESAKRIIEQTYNVTPYVIPHGPLHTEEQMRHYRKKHSENYSDTNHTVYVHVRGGRINLDWKRLLRFAPGIESETGYRLTFGIKQNTSAHEYVKGSPQEEQAYVKVGAEYTDEELSYVIAKSKALLLAYKWGSHSGLVELAHDIGTPVLIYDTGHYRDQKPTALIQYIEDDREQEHAVSKALSVLSNSFKGTGIHERLHTLDQFQQDHKRLYERERQNG